MQSSQSPSAEAPPVPAGLKGDRSADASIRRRFVEAARRAEIVGLVNASTTEAELGRRFTDELCEVFEAELAFIVDEGGERRAPRAVAVVGLDPESVPCLLKSPESAQAVRSGRAVALPGRTCSGSAPGVR
jgi:hypothetical protein